MVALFLVSTTTTHAKTTPTLISPTPHLDQMQVNLDASLETADRILLLLADIKADLCYASLPLEALSLEALSSEAEGSTPKED
jgi:hypothetical protein